MNDAHAIATGSTLTSLPPKTKKSTLHERFRNSSFYRRFISRDNDSLLPEPIPHLQSSVSADAPKRIEPNAS